MEVGGVGVDGHIYRTILPYALLSVEDQDNAWENAGLTVFGFTELLDLGYFNWDLAECPVMNQNSIAATFANEVQLEELKV